jgi:hypothetical protein
VSHVASFRSVYLTRAFWLEAADRAVKSAAQAVILGLGLSEGLDLFTIDWRLAAGIAGGGAFLSLLTSLISARAGTAGNASVLSIPGSTPPGGA